MSCQIGAVTLRLETPSGGRGEAERVERELRAELAGALRDAVANFAVRGEVVIVPRVRLSVRAPLARVDGRELARRIADSVVHAAVHESGTLGASASDASEGTAERTLRVLEVCDGLRLDAATEAAAWLVAMALDRRSAVRKASPHADLESLPSAAAFLELCERAGMRPVLRALGPAWSYRLVLRMRPDEARRALRMLDDGLEPDAETLRRSHAAGDELRREDWHERLFGRTRGRFASDVRESAPAAPHAEVLTLLVAMQGVFADCAGAARAARLLATARRGSGAPVAEGAAEEEAALESVCTGFWLLLPHLARRLRGVNAERSRAVSAAVAERLWGETAREDPAVLAFASTGALPAEMRIDRLCVTVLRDFARTLLRFEGARPGYILQAMLFGPGEVKRTSEGWSATLPRSPVRVVLERAALLGVVETPWSEPVLEMVRDP